ncbi:MAG: WecB/TagA/CpsF family glycosyltransferase [Desulfurococcales archaeon]|nr:WecB/TagA/CpsF family glycosyltransferase [Desulfurococcales archaeon]
MESVPCDEREGYRICGVPVKATVWSDLDPDSIKHTVRVYTINMEMLYWAIKYSWYRETLSRGCTTADGKWVQWAVSKIHGVKVDHIPGSLLVPRILEHAAGRGEKVVFIGDTPSTHERARRVLEEKYPGILLGFYDPGRITLEDAENGTIREEIIARIAGFLRDEDPVYAFFTLSLPVQERVIDLVYGRAAVGGLKIMAGVGGTLRMLAGLEKPAPKPVRSLGLEWLWRLVQNPRRLGKVERSLRAMICVIGEAIRGKQQG